MAKFIKNIALWLIFASFIYVVLLAAVGEIFPGFLKKHLNYNVGSYGHAYTRFQDVDTVENVDILFLGSSHTYRGFDTRIYEKEGYKTFNLGSSAQTHIQTNVLLKRYLDQLNPDLVIYEVYPYMFNLDGVESSLDLIANDENDLYSVEMGLQLNHVKVYNALIFGFYQDIFNRNKNFSEMKKRGSDEYIQGGYVERENRFFFTRDTTFSERRWWLRQEQFDAFEENLQLLKNKNADIILVQVPITSSYYKAHINNDKFDNRIEKYGTYYNFNKILQLDDSLHFMDKHHLNQNGVKAVNKAILEIIKKQDPKITAN